MIFSIIMNYLYRLIHETVESINTQESEPEGAPAQGFCVFFRALFHEREEMDEASSIRGFFPMYHLTRNHKKLLRKNGSKVMLSLCVAMALSGGLVKAEGIDVNPWVSREALEGDPIEVNQMSGGDGKLQAGRDETGKVLIHSLVTYGNPEAYVKGKQITVEDAINWSGKIFIGSDATDLVDLKGIKAGTDAETTIDGNAISIGKLSTGSGTFTIGNKNTNSVVINDFGAGVNSGTTINGHNASVGQVNIYKGQVTIHTDGDFKVAQVDKGDNLQDVGVAGDTVGGNLYIRAGSLKARKLSVAGQSKADIHITGDNGLYLSEGISATEAYGSDGKGGITRIDSPVITIDALSGNKGIYASNSSNVSLQGKNLFIKGGLGITDSSLTAAETGTLVLGKKNAGNQDYAEFRFTNSHVSLGSETSNTNLYGNIITYGQEKEKRASLDIHGKNILIAGVEDGNNAAFKDAIVTHGDIITVGDDRSNVELQGRILNAASSVTVNGQKVHISSINAVNHDIVNANFYTQEAVRATGNADTTTTIGSTKTDDVTINGITWVDNGSLSMHGKNIQLSYAQGIALNGHQGAYVYAGGNETERLGIHGQVLNGSASVMKLFGQHITIDSTKYHPSKGDPYCSQSLIAGANGIDAGDENTTKTIFISSGLNARAADINVKGKNITIGASNYFNNDKSIKDRQDGYIAYAANGNVNIGSENSDTVHLYDGQLLAAAKGIDIQGKNISIASKADYITPDKDGSVTMIQANGGNVTIGGKHSDTVDLSGGKHSDTVDLSGGKLLANGGDIDIQGKNISIDGKQQWAGQTNGGELTIGSQNSDSISIHGKGGIYALGGEVGILGKQISIQADTDNALMNDGGPITVGGEDTESIDVSGGIETHGSQISLTGSSISISKGNQANAIYTNGGTVEITALGGAEAHISGPIRNDNGTIDISLTGRSSHLESQIITNKNFMDNNSSIKSVGAMTTLNLYNKASWNPKECAAYAVTDRGGEMSSLAKYNGNDGIIYLDNNSKQTITVSNFVDKGSWIHEDIYGSKNTGNDALHIDDNYEGNTHFWLVNREDTDKGIVGTILASAGRKIQEVPSDPHDSPYNTWIHFPRIHIRTFTADHFTASGMSKLFFKTYGLSTQVSHEPKVKWSVPEKNYGYSSYSPEDTYKFGSYQHKGSDGTVYGEFYDQDLIITGVTNHVTNDKGQYTPTVSAALSGSSLMYYTWRTENDKMLQRVGDLRENEGEETGLWTRIRGSRIGRDGYRGFKNQYKVYEIGYDAKTEDNDRMKSFTGIALSYLDGKGYYADGQGTNQATSAAIYHTDIHKTGHYLDLVFRIRHMNERFHTRDTVDTDIGPVTEDHSASLDTTGLSFSAEYGRKKFMGKGWYVEPQTQWTLGYLGPVQYEMDNGTRVEQPGITSFVGRAGFNLGRQVNENSIVYLKANVYHEFGGHSPLHLYAGDESLSFTDTFDDTWFEYGAGFAVKLGNGLSLYGDVEKTAGSHFYKDWQWNAGLRYSF